MEMYVLFLETVKGTRILDKGPKEEVKKSYNDWKHKLVKYDFLEFKEDNKIVLFNKSLVDDLIFCTEEEYKADEQRKNLANEIYRKAQNIGNIGESELLDQGYK